MNSPRPPSARGATTGSGARPCTLLRPRTSRSIATLRHEAQADDCPPAPRHPGEDLDARRGDAIDLRATAGRSVDATVLDNSSALERPPVFFMKACRLPPTGLVWRTRMSSTTADAAPVGARVANSAASCGHRKSSPIAALRRRHRRQRCLRTSRRLSTGTMISTKLV